MALDPSKLKSELLKIQPGSFAETSRAWAQAYANYAADAQSLGGGVPASLDPGILTAATAFAVAFAAGFDPVSTANQMANALTAFWLVPPVVFGTGLVTAVAGTAVLGPALVSAWLENMASQAPVDVAMANIAAVLHAFTITVVTTTPGSPPLVGPIF